MLQARGVELEVVGREVAGRPVAGRPRKPYLPWLFGLVPLGLLSIIVVPMVFTVAWSFQRAPGCAFGSYCVLFHDDALRATLGSLIWILIAVGLVVAGFVIALVSYRVRWLWWILRPALVIPFSVSSMVAGAAFRLLFDPVPERGTVTAAFHAVFGASPLWLGPAWIRFVLVSAFAWVWLGFVVFLFRAGLESIPGDLARTVRAEGLRGWRRLVTVEIPVLWPLTSVLGVTVMLAAVRLFDLVLITAPEPMQTEVDVLALHWWRTTNASTAQGPPASLAVVLFVIVSVIAFAVSRGLRRRWAMPEPVSHAPVPEPPDERSRGRLLGLLVGLPVAVLWLLPLLVLVATALHDPRAAGLAGWWRPGFGLGSLGAVADRQLAGALLGTLLIAGVAVFVVVVVAVPTAWLLAWGGRPRLARFVTTAFVVLAVVPVQMYAAPLRAAFAALGLSSARVPLALVHAAAGLPFAVLLLRTAFASVPGSLVSEALLGQTRQTSLINRVRKTYQPVLVAVAVLEFVLVWNDFIVGFLISGPGATPLALLLWGEGRQFGTSSGLVAAGAVLSALLPAALLLVTWRTVVRGLTIGSKP